MVTSCEFSDFFNNQQTTPVDNPIENPTDPTGPTDPTDPAGPTDPIDPTDPVDPAGPSDPIDPTDPVDPIDTKINEMIELMSLEEKICQMIMLACRTRNGTNFTSITPEISNLLANYSFNGIILYAQNIVTNEQTYDLIKQIQDANLKENRPGLLIAIDQEGGRVVRLEEGTTTPGNMALGAIDDLEVTEQIASLIGGELATLGFNTNFAPVVDVNNNPNNPVIGTRSFSDNPYIVSNQAAAYIRGLNNYDVIGSLKHFPGHGDTDTDSHTGLPLINKTLDELKNNELIPYINNINDIEMFMTAHIVYPQIETNTYTSIATGKEIYLPATLSKTILTDVLRDDLGFEGVVITDAMEMDAINKHFTKADSARLAINAGVDIILMPVDISTSNGINNLLAYIQNIMDQVASGDISIDRINESVRRILILKSNHGLLEGYEMAPREEVSQVGSSEHHEIEFEATIKAITLVKNEGALPLTNDDNVLIVTTSTSETMPVEYGLALASSSAAVMSLDQINLAKVNTLLAGYNKIVIFSQMGNKAYLTSSTANKISQLIDAINNLNKKAIVLSTNLPYDAARFTNASAFVICYSPKGMSEDPRVEGGNIKQYGPNIPTAIYMMYASTSEDVNFTGKLPIEIKALNSSFAFTDVILYNRSYGLSIE